MGFLSIRNTSYYCKLELRAETIRGLLKRTYGIPSQRMRPYINLSLSNGNDNAVLLERENKQINRMRKRKRKQVLSYIAK